MKKIKISFFMLCFFMVAGISNQVFAQSSFIENVSDEYATAMKSASTDMASGDEASSLLFQELEQLRNANPQTYLQEATVSAKYHFAEVLLTQIKLGSDMQNAFYVSYYSTKDHCLKFKGVDVNETAILEYYVALLKK